MKVEDGTATISEATSVRAVNNGANETTLSTAAVAEALAYLVTTLKTGSEVDSLAAALPGLTALETVLGPGLAPPGTGTKFTTEVLTAE